MLAATQTLLRLRLPSSDSEPLTEHTTTIKSSEEQLQQQPPVPSSRQRHSHRHHHRHHHHHHRQHQHHHHPHHHEQPHPHRTTRSARKRCSLETPEAVESSQPEREQNLASGDTSAASSLSDDVSLAMRNTKARLKFK